MPREPLRAQSTHAPVASETTSRMGTRPVRPAQGQGQLGAHRAHTRRGVVRCAAVEPCPAGAAGSVLREGSPRQEWPPQGAEVPDSARGEPVSGLSRFL